MSEPAYNAGVDLLGRNLTPERAVRPYLITDRRTWSYGDVAASADAAGAGLLDLGLRRGDRVLLVTRDSPEFVAVFWGAIKAGLVPVPVAHGLSEADLRFLLADSRAALVVFDASSAPAAGRAAAAVGVPSVRIGDPAVGSALSWGDVCTTPAMLEPAPTGPGDMALWLYTSGTTGEPKGVMHTHADLRAAPDALARQVVGLRSDDVVLSVSKMFFAYGLGNSVYLPAAAGAAVVVNEGPSIPAAIEGLIGRTHPSILFGVPSFFAGLARLESAALSSIRMALSAGEALSSDLLESFRRRFGLTLLDGLGSTEALHHVTSNRPDDVAPGSAGRPLDEYGVRVLDRGGDPAPEGELGELWISGPTVFAGYWRRPELTERALRDGWVRTGDVARVRDGRVYHEGRLDDLMKLGGIWVAPGEIEAVLREDPRVMDAAVVVADDGAGVPVLRAFVSVTGTADALPGDLVRRCRRRLASFKVPKSVEVMEELPRTPTGKLRRFVLRGDS